MYTSKIAFLLGYYAGAVFDKNYDEMNSTKAQILTLLDEMEAKISKPQKATTSFSRNFIFNSIAEANKKWDQVLLHHELLTEFHYTYYHIPGFPDYVVSVSGSHENMEKILGLLETEMIRQ